MRLQKTLLTLLILFPFIVHATAKVNFACEPIEGETSFRLKGYFYASAQGDNMGVAHSYAVFGDYVPIEGCRVPWYEKFTLNGSTSVKFMLHWQEYMPGCMQRFMIPLVSAEGHMWVAKKDEPNTKSKVIRAYCHVNKL